ncbi:MAG: von Willebrand factor type A domain-containing protein [Chitinophagaceae bacterium]
MKRVSYILLLIFSHSGLPAQYYFRGEITDEGNKPLQNVKIVLHSSGYVYYSGTSGGFGITSARATDSVSFALDGYQPASVQLENNKFANITLKLLQTSGSVQKKKLISFTKDLKPEESVNWSVGGETYSSLLENDFIQAKMYPETGFAISINKASYSNVRRFISMDNPVPPDAIRIEEMINYFNFSYKEPQKDSMFSFESHFTACPWNENNYLLYLKLCAKKVDLDTMPSSNLVFLVDISGSMDMPNRLPLLKSSFKSLVNNLRSKDTISIVVYGSTVGVWMQPTSGKEKLKIQKAIEGLNPGGSTPGASGISTAYRIAKSQFIKGGNNRVILATDGDFNVGQTSEADLEKLISLHRQTGIYLTCLGVGMGNYKDSKLEVLAKKGNGNFAYLDDEKEAEKVLVKELTQTLFTVADDAYCTIRFNPKLVRQYRLIGFDNKLNAVIDSLSELEGGEIGSGHTMLAMVEIVPASSLLNPDNFYGPNNALAAVRVSYKLPSDTTRRTSVYSCSPVYTEFNELDSCYRFASSVVMFASLLRRSNSTKFFSWRDVVLLANESYNRKDTLEKEFVTLVVKARKIYSRGKRRKR